MTTVQRDCIFCAVLFGVQNQFKFPLFAFFDLNQKKNNNLQAVNIAATFVVLSSFASAGLKHNLH